MGPSERIAIIAEIARRLSAEKWGIIDLTLRQFGRPTTDMWQGNAEDYIIQGIEDAEPEILVGMARHLGFEADRARPVTEPSFWRDGCVRVFISHLAEHRQFAAALQTRLSAYEISSFVAHNDIEPTREWADEIESALGTCDAAVALMHDQFHASKWVDQELGYVMGRGVPILTARLGQDPYGFLGRFQALKCQREEAGMLAHEVFSVLAANKATMDRVSSAIVQRLERSESFADAKATTEILEKVIYWDQTLTARCRDAVKVNNQVSESWGVPEKIEAHIGRMEGRGK